jgi:hypothetical protein
MSAFVRRLYRVWDFIFSPRLVLSSAFLLLLRVYFFWQLFLTGKGKHANIGKVNGVLCEFGNPHAFGQRLFYRLTGMLR